MKGINLIHEFIKEIQESVQQGGSPFTRDAPRILLTGVPVGIDSDKVIRLIERAGANVVCFESCGGYKSVSLIDEEKEPLQALAEKYLSTPCSIMSPNTGRYEQLGKMIEGFSVGGGRFNVAGLPYLQR
jgi:benzoyl-CoA reductase/2-hydroxyglutaryl-CoA dehydratase subunit BcrC/BadD/HgdB